MSVTAACRLRDAAAPTRSARQSSDVVSALFADAEAREDAAEQVIRREFAGDLVQVLLRGAQLLGDELAGAALAKLTLGGFDMSSGASERIQMPLARRHGAAFRRLKSHARLQVSAQH